MKNDLKINQQIEEILMSINHIKRAEASPYLLTRINAKLNLQTISNWEKISSFICRPVIMALGLFLILLINISVILSNKTIKSSSSSDHSISAIAEEDDYTANYTTIENFDTP